MSGEDVENIKWSPWLNYEKSSINSVPESAGVFKMHVQMKILYIGSSQSLRQTLLDTLSDPCLNQARRFSYAITESADKVKDRLLIEFRNNHFGKSPPCME